jgi:protein disulfide-isomerase
MTNHSNNGSPAPDNTNPKQKKSQFHFWRCFWLSFLVLSLAYAWYSFYAPANKVAWAADFGAAQQESAESDKPIVLFFTGSWCSPCRIMKREVWNDEQILAMVNEQFIAVEVDVDDPKNAELVTRYKIGGSPVTIVTDSHGDVLDWRAGRINKSEFLELVESTDAGRAETAKASN